MTCVADLYPCAVSHTTDDLVFEWDPIMPLDVDSGIELPQLELTNNFTGDCTTAYSTGTYYSVTQQHVLSIQEEIFMLNILQRKFTSEICFKENNFESCELNEK